MVGDTEDDQLGSARVVALANDNYVIASPLNDTGGGLVLSVSDAGSVQMVDGVTGETIGEPIVGDAPDDQLGSGSVTALPNSNYVIASPLDDAGGGLALLNIDAGSVRLVDGASGEQIGPAIFGDAESDQLGSNRVTALANNNFVIVSSNDDEAGIVDAGSARLANGTTGEPLGDAIIGATPEDFDFGSAFGAPDGDYYLLILRLFDNNGLVDSGQVRLIDQ